tara:strand:- start:3401 stop:4012 length:612 start_codon:yes stop_codon:yes gene_type:complete
MVFKFFKKRRDIEEKFSHLHGTLNDSFSRIKDDMQGVGDWIKHLDESKQEHNDKLEDMEDRLRSVEEFMYNLIEQEDREDVSKQLSKQERTAVCPKQTVVLSKQGVQTDIEKELYRLTAMERAVVWSLLNTDILLGYSDLSRILGKDESTVRGQINNIKKKMDLLEEKSESNGKKRFYISEEKKRDILIKYTGKKVKIMKSET